MGICDCRCVGVVDSIYNDQFSINKSSSHKPGKITANRVKKQKEPMLKNHLKIAWRNLIKDRQFTLLNVLGLSAGLACALLIFLWVNDERSYDKVFASDSQLYQVMEHRKADGETKVSDESSGLVSEIL